jgi:hypothetical protein
MEHLQVAFLQSLEPASPHPLASLYTGGMGANSTTSENARSSLLSYSTKFLYLNMQYFTVNRFVGATHYFIMKEYICRRNVKLVNRFSVKFLDKKDSKVNKPFS